MRSVSICSLPILSLLLIAQLFVFSSQATAATASRSSAFVYDSNGLLTREIIEPGDSNLCVVTEYGYDTYGNQTRVTTRNCNGSSIPGVGNEAAAPSGDAVFVSRTTTTEYDNNLSVANGGKGRFPTKTTNAVGHTETRVYDPKWGAITSLTGPNNLTTSWQYDGFGRKIKETRADTTHSTWTYQTNCELANSNVPNLAYCVKAKDSTHSHASYAYFDKLNRNLVNSVRNFADTDWIDNGRVVYNNRGQIIKQYQSYHRSDASSLDSNYQYSSTQYDILGRVYQNVAYDKQNNTLKTLTTTTTYAGLKTTSTFSDGSLSRKTVTEKNSQGQTIRVLDPQNNSLTFSYDPFGNLTRTTDVAGNIIQLSYDPRGRKTKMIDPDMGTWYYYYNALGELIRQIDAKNYTSSKTVVQLDTEGKTVRMSYDKLGRMTQRREPDLISNWVYDTASNGKGKLHEASTTTGYKRTHSYDSLGRLMTTRTVIGDQTFDHQTSYDSNTGRVKSQIYPTGFSYQNIYNGNGYLKEVVNPADTTKKYWTANTIDAQGRVLQQTYGNGIVVKQKYHIQSGRLETQTAGNNNSVQNMSYTYDSLGNVTGRQDHIKGITESYLYDSLNRLTNATVTASNVNTTTSYAYNAIGNITCKSDISACSSSSPNYTYNASGTSSVRPHAVSQITGTLNGVTNPTFSYDANGNLISGAGRSLVWTSYNMVKKITQNTNTAEFWYDSEHSRIKQVKSNGSTTYWLSPRYDTGFHFDKVIQSDGKIKYTSFIYAGDLQIGEYQQFATTAAPTSYTNQLRYIHKDNLGSVAVITDSNGAVLERLAYDPFGKRRNTNGSADTTNTQTSAYTDHGYTGHEMLDELDLINMNGRVYDPSIARFVSADFLIPYAGDLQSYNRYSYVNNNPLIYTDPSGQIKLKKVFRAALAIAVMVYAPQISASIGWTSAAASMGMSSAVANGMLGGALAGAINTGTFKGALIGGATGGAFGAVGDVWPSGFANIAGHAGVGCASSMASGGACGSGAMSAGFGAAVSPLIGTKNIIAGTVISAVAGGIGSVLGGGKFDNGAWTAAFGYLFNAAAHQCPAGACHIEGYEPEYASVAEQEQLAGMFNAFSPNPFSKLTGAPLIVKALNGNLASGQKAQHIYEIIDMVTGETVKTGISQSVIRSDGKSPRAEVSVRKFNKMNGSTNRFASTIIGEIPAGVGARQTILNMERANAQGLREAGQLRHTKYHVRP